MGRASKRACESAPPLALDGSLERALELADAERGRLVRAIRVFGLPRADVDDVVQVAVTEMALNWNDRIACLSVCQLYARLLRTAHLRARDAVRRERRRMRWEERFRSVPPESPIDPERTVLLAREQAAYRTAIRRLPPGLLEPVLLAVESDLTCKQIAVTLGLPVGTVKTRLRRARALCREPRPARGWWGQQAENDSGVRKLSKKGRF